MIETFIKLILCLLVILGNIFSVECSGISRGGADIYEISGYNFQEIDTVNETVAVPANNHMIVQVSNESIKDLIFKQNPKEKNVLKKMFKELLNNSDDNDITNIAVYFSDHSDFGIVPGTEMDSGTYNSLINLVKQKLREDADLNLFVILTGLKGGNEGKRAFKFWFDENSVDQEDEVEEDDEDDQEEDEDKFGIFTDVPSDHSDNESRTKGIRVEDHEDPSEDDMLAEDEMPKLLILDEQKISGQISQSHEEVEDDVNRTDSQSNQQHADDTFIDTPLHTLNSVVTEAPLLSSIAEETTSYIDADQKNEMGIFEEAVIEESVDSKSETSASGSSEKKSEVNDHPNLNNLEFKIDDIENELLESPSSETLCTGTLITTVACLAVVAIAAMIYQIQKNSIGESVEL